MLKASGKEKNAVKKEGTLYRGTITMKVCRIQKRPVYSWSWAKLYETQPESIISLPLILLPGVLSALISERPKKSNF